MRTVTFVGLLALLPACGLTIEEERAAEDPFHQVVESWVGANVNDMIDVWGRPDTWQAYQSPDDPLRAHWEIRHLSGSSLATTDGGGGRLVRTCEAFVVADAAGTILAAEAKTDRCVEFMGDRLAELHR